MNVLVQEWIDRAEGDFNTAVRESRVRKLPNYDAVCFHCQQCAEKYLKAFLQQRSTLFPKTHDLIELLELCVSCEHRSESQRESLLRLRQYAVDYRYPGEAANKEEALEAVRAMREVRSFVRDRLGIKEK